MVYSVSNSGVHNQQLKVTVFLNKTRLDFETTKQNGGKNLTENQLGEARGRELRKDIYTCQVCLVSGN